MTNTNEKVLLVGNGINRVFCEGGHSWENILEELNKLGSGETDLKNPFKPFPFAFEEILSEKHPSYDEATRVLKHKVAEILERITVGKAHEMIADNDKYKTVLTTNYEYTLEIAYAERKHIEAGFRKVCNKSSTAESKHSLHRRYEFPEGQFSVWHIHGEIDHKKASGRDRVNSSESVLIGYYQYVAYLNKIYNHFLDKHTKTSTKYEEKAWVDFFFHKDIDIIGLTLDFSEIHLWWILNRRYSLMMDTAAKSKKQTFKPENTITYYYPTLNTDKKQSAIVEMLEAFGVDIRPVACNSFEEYYCKVLREQ